MEIILDTNVFQKYYGYYNNKSNNDKQVDLEYLNQFLDKAGKLILPFGCLYELFCKSQILKNNSYNKKACEILDFIMKKRIHIGYIDSGKIVYSKIGCFDFWVLNIKKTILNAYKLKMEFEQTEIYEYVLYTLFVAKYLIIDIINTKLYENNIKKTLTQKSINKILAYFKENEQNYKDKIKKFVYNKVVEGYVEENPKKTIKDSIMQVYQEFFYEMYNILSNEGDVLRKICQDEIDLLYKYPNKYEYIKCRIEYIEKKTGIKDYLSIINESYTNEIKNLNYNDYFCKYLMFILKKQIRKANFDKNDAIDNSLFYFKTNNNFILSFEKNIIGFIESNDIKNYNFIQQFCKK